ncbi:MAG TPA: DUF5605 domain-containing protein, partial [Verrucomicrobiae bacterium]|nr:DUF5605 domain-containing protein [Verrucomicrobiae bacterium]
KHGLTDGLKFKADVIDTWNMTITPVPGDFITKKKDGYYFEDANGRSVSLPGRPYMALRIQRVDNESNQDQSVKPMEKN